MFGKKDLSLLLTSVLVSSLLLVGGFALLLRMLSSSPDSLSSQNVEEASSQNEASNAPSPVTNRQSAGEQILIKYEAEKSNSPDFASLKQNGAEAFGRGDYDEAVDSYSRAIEISQNSPETLIYLNNSRIGSKDSFTVAVPVPISGPNPGNALEMLRGFAQAQNEVNESGGINGKGLKIKIYDDSDSAEVAEEVAANIVRDTEILAVAGHWSSGTSLSAAPIYNSNKIVFIAPLSTTIELSDLGPYVFRINANTYTGGRALANYALEKLNAKNSAIFFDSESTYSKELEAQFSTDFKLGGGSVIDRFDLAESSFNAADSVERALNRDVKVLLLIPAPNSVDKALQVITINRKRMFLLGEMGNLYTPKTLQVGGEDAQGMVMAPSWHIEADSSSDFTSRSRQLWNADVSWATAMSYNAAQAIVKALREDSAPDRFSLQQILRSSDFFVTGVSGEFRFLQSGDASTTVQLVEIKADDNSRSGIGYDFVPIQ